MKILYIITGLGQGGAEKVVCDLSDALCARGHEAKIVYLTGNILTHPSNPNIELINLKLNTLSDFPKAYIELSKLIKSYKPDVVHSHMVHANILARLVRLTTPITKLINTAHSNDEGGWNRMLLYRLTHKLADFNTNVSKSAVSAFEERKAIPKGGMHTIYNGINLNYFHFNPFARSKLLTELRIDEDVTILLAVGRFHESKDYPSLLKAIKILKHSNLNSFKLLIAGEGDLRPHLEGMINDLNIEKNVLILGRRDDIPDLMSAADLFILASKHEGFGLVVAEAMACECLVVATNCGGAAEVLNNNNFIVEPCNPKALASKIDLALNLTECEYKKVIKNNLSHVQSNFSLDSIVDKWLGIYHEY